MDLMDPYSYWALLAVNDMHAAWTNMLRSVRWWLTYVMECIYVSLVIFRSALDDTWLRSLRQPETSAWCRDVPLHGLISHDRRQWGTFSIGVFSSLPMKFDNVPTKMTDLSV